MRYVSLLFIFTLGVLVWQWTLAAPSERPSLTPNEKRPEKTSLPPLPDATIFIAPEEPPH